MQQIISKAEKQPLITERQPHSRRQTGRSKANFLKEFLSQRGRLQQQGTENKSS
jgi:hypothetical protein